MHELQDRAGCCVHRVCRGATEPGWVIRGTRAWTVGAWTVRSSGRGPPLACRIVDCRIFSRTSSGVLTIELRPVANRCSPSSLHIPISDLQSRALDLIGIFLGISSRDLPSLGPLEVNELFSMHCTGGRKTNLLRRHLGLFYLVVCGLELSRPVEPLV